MPNTCFYAGVNYRENNCELNPHAELFIPPNVCDHPIPINSEYNTLGKDGSNLGNPENSDGTPIFSSPLNICDPFTPAFSADTTHVWF